MKKFILSICFVLLFSAGCSKPYSTKKISTLTNFKERHQSALNTSKASLPTQQQLRLLFLDEQYEEDPLAVIEKLYHDSYALNDKNMMRAAAELLLLNARSNNDKDGITSTALYLKAAELAYDYLFSEDSFEYENNLTPSYRFMAEIYNRSVSRLIHIHGEQELPWEDSILRTFGRRTYEFSIVRKGPVLWDPTIFDMLLPADDLRIKGLRNEYFEKGLGSPLLGVVKNPQQHPELGSKIPQQGVIFPVTAVLTFAERGSTDGGQSRKVNLKFYDTMKTATAMIGTRQVPLEADYSTPLGLLLSAIENKGGGIAGMLRSDEYADFAGMYMLEPIDMTKTPVVMVHGLMSSPETWVEMFNDLRGQKEIRENFQFWFFKYPTGLPVLYSSSILRSELLEIFDQYDPERKNPRFNNTVLIGHSMGGLLSRSMVQNSKNVYWESVFKEPIDTISISDKDKASLREMFYFEQLSFIKRVVFIATPHQGSDLANKWFTRIGAAMIRLPSMVTGLTKDILSVGQEDLVVDMDQFSKKGPNSLDNLSPSSNYVKVTNEIPLADDIKYHSIIGVRKSKKAIGSSDGVVPYWSSHQDISLSEVLVPSGHSAHRHPLAIAELKRILLIHLAEDK